MDKNEVSWEKCKGCRFLQEDVIYSGLKKYIKITCKITGIAVRLTGCMKED